MAVEDPAAERTHDEARGIDSWLRRYSRWRERRLIRMAQVPLSALALESLYLCVCVLVDGVVLPWAVVVLTNGFSALVFVILFIPLAVLEGILYRTIRRRGTPKKE